jgi:urease gamma subunit
MATTKAKKRTTKVTKYQKLVKAKARACKGNKGAAAEARKAATEYIADAVKKGKTKADATKSANKVLKRACKVVKKGPVVKRKVRKAA